MTVSKLAERIYRTEAIVLRRTELGEADRILTLYTPQWGKFRAIAKGIESKVDALDTKVEALTTLLQGFIERVTRKREG